MGKVRVPRRVLEGLEAVRTSGLTNMFDRRAVTTLASEFGFDEASRWIKTHRKQFAEGIFHGFTATEEK